MENRTDEQAGGRWIFPKELEGVYTREQLKYFIGQAELHLRDSVQALRTIRDRHYTLINIMLVIIGTLVTILITADLNRTDTFFLTVLLIYFCAVSAISLLHLKHYYQEGPGFKPSEIFNEKARNWTIFYHKDMSEFSRLYTMLEGQQGALDFNRKERDRQLKSLRHITLCIFSAISAAAIYLVISLIVS